MIEQPEQEPEYGWPEEEEQAMPTTRFERYQEALRFLRESAAAIDQAHAVLKEIDLDSVEVETHLLAPVRYIGIAKLSGYVEAMTKEVETAECDECGHALSRHADQKYGCSIEGGDRPVTGRDGHSIDVASGPCSCAWGQMTEAA